LSGAKNNVDASNSRIQSNPLFFNLSNTGGGKIKNISNKYKRNMKHKKNRSHYKKHKHFTRTRRISRGRSRSRSVALSRTFYGGKTHKNRRSRHNMFKYKGGYSQYQNNMPNTPSYSVGGILNYKDSALANPPPINVLSNCTNCVDNYNHYTNKGFPSQGH